MLVFFSMIGTVNRAFFFHKENCDVTFLHKHSVMSVRRCVKNDLRSGALAFCSCLLSLTLQDCFFIFGAKRLLNSVLRINFTDIHIYYQGSLPIFW